MFWGRSSSDEYGKDSNIPDDEDEYAGGTQTTKKCNNQPKTHGLNGGEARYEVLSARGAVGVQVDRFRAIELGKKLK